MGCSRHAHWWNNRRPLLLPLVGDLSHQLVRRRPIHTLLFYPQPMDSHPQMLPLSPPPLPSPPQRQPPPPTSPTRFSFSCLALLGPCGSGERPFRGQKRSLSADSRQRLWKARHENQMRGAPCGVLALFVHVEMFQISVERLICVNKPFKCPSPLTGNPRFGETLQTLSHPHPVRKRISAAALRAGRPVLEPPSQVASQSELSGIVMVG